MISLYTPKTSENQVFWDKLRTDKWCHGVVVITTAQLHSTKPELRFCAGSNPARGVSEIRDGEDLWQWSRLEIRLNAFHRSTIPQKQFIIIFIIIWEQTYKMGILFLILITGCSLWALLDLNEDLSKVSPMSLPLRNISQTRSFKTSLRSYFFWEKIIPAIYVSAMQLLRKQGMC